MGVAFLVCSFTASRPLTFLFLLCALRASMVAHLVKNPPAMQETLVGLLDWEDPLEKG